jgi:hypothetical protein
MNAEAGFSLLDVFDLPEPRREIVVYLARNGPAVPILQFACARLTEFSDHGPNQTFCVKAFASQLGYVLGLSQTEHVRRPADDEVFRLEVTLPEVTPA